MGEVTASQATLTDALLEATPSKAVRIEILDRQCAALQAWHDLIQNRFEAGSARAIDAVTSKAAYLQVQLRRLLEQSAPDGPDGTPDGKALRRTFSVCGRIASQPCSRPRRFWSCTTEKAESTWTLCGQLRLP